MRRRRVTYVPQMEAVECGAASLAMVLAFHGHHAPLPEVREACGVARDGATAKRIVQAARKYGLEPRARRLEPAQLAEVTTPAILHWEMNHFVVLERWTAKEAFLVDPAMGRRVVAAEQFSRSFTGVCIELAPGPDLKRRAHEPLAARRFFSALRGNLGALAMVAGTSLALSMLLLALPLVTQLIIDHVLLRGRTSWLYLVGVGALALVAFHLVLDLIRGAIVIRLKAAIERSVTQGFVAHLLRLPLPFLLQRGTADLMSRVQGNRVLRDLLAGESTAVLIDSVLLVLWLSLMIWYEPFLGAVVAVAGAVYVGLFFAARPAQVRRYQERLLKDVKESSQLVQMIRGIATLRSAGTESTSHNRWLNALVEALNASARETDIQDRVQAALALVRGAVPVAVLAIGALRVLDGHTTPGTLVGFQMLQAGVLLPLSKLVYTLLRLQVLPVILGRMNDVLDTAPEPTPRRAAPPFDGTVQFEHVSFRYGPAAPLVLDGIDLTIRRGEKVAIVGPSGSGKSTLARLLLALYQPTEGRVLIDDVDLAALDPATARRQIGVVLQDTATFEGTVRDNISLYHPEANIEDVMNAARIARIHDDITALPRGYDSSLAGGVLSGGQRQRLALARAVLHRPAILILDEATSALDAVTEAAIEDYLTTRPCTRLVIAHRLSTVRSAHRIVVLEAGRIVEQGTHAELMAAHGVYAALASKGEQSAPARTTASPVAPLVSGDDLMRFEALAFLTARQRQALCEVLQRTSYAAGTTMVEQGTQAPGLFLVERGRVEVRIDEPGLPPLTVARLEPGQLFGEVSLLDGSLSTADTVAADAVTVLQLPYARYRELRDGREPLWAALLVGLARTAARRLDDSEIELHKLGEQGFTPPFVAAAVATSAALSLAETGLGSALSTAELAELEAVGDHQRHPEGHVLRTDGELADCLLLLLDGQVMARRQGGAPKLRGPGTLLGGREYFDRSRPDGLGCTSPVRLFRLRYDALDRLLEAGSGAGHKILSHLAQELARRFRLTGALLREAVAEKKGEKAQALRARREASALAREHESAFSIARAVGRLPVVTHGEAPWALACCLTALLHFHGRPVPFATVAETVGAGTRREPQELELAALHFGLAVRRMDLTAPELCYLEQPLLVAWRDGGWVLAERWLRDELWIMSPLGGRIAVPASELAGHMLGPCYEILPDSARGVQLSPWRRMLALLASRRRAVVATLAATGAMQLAAVAMPVALGAVIGVVLPSSDANLLTVIVVAATSLVLFQTWAGFWRSRVALYLRSHFDRDLLNQLMAHVLRLPLGYIERERPGELLQRFQSVRVLRELLTTQGATAVLDGLVLVLAIVPVFSLAGSLGLLVLAAIAVHVLAMLLSYRKLRALAAAQLHESGVQQDRLMEVLNGLTTLRATGAEDGGLKRWLPAYRRELECELGQQRLLGHLVALLTATREAAVVSFTFLGAAAVLRGESSLGALVAAQGVGVMLFASMHGTFGQYLGFVRGAVHLGRVREILSVQIEQPGADVRPPGRLRGRIELERVGFRYTDDGPMVLDGVSLTVEPGSKVALVGASGCGKSTLAKLLLGFYLPTSGQIRFDGRDVAHLDLREVRRQIGVVLQETFLFGASIRANLSLNAPDAHMDAVRAAARTAAIEELIESLPMRYDTILAEGGATFSGGQRQRLAIARALVHNPAILLLDEATSALDNAAQDAVERNLRQSSCTRVVVAHRLSTIRDADQILVMDHGRIVERGKHDELVERRGAYYALVKAQLG